jgi:hypothetical protein
LSELEAKTETKKVTVYKPNKPGMTQHCFNKENQTQLQNLLHQIPKYELHLREATKFKLQPNNMNREDGLDSQVMDDPLPQTKDIIC